VKQKNKEHRLRVRQDKGFTTTKAFVNKRPSLYKCSKRVIYNRLDNKDS